MDLNEISEFLLSAARSVGAEVTSPWFYLQLGLILAGAGIAFGAGAAIRSRGGSAPTPGFAVRMTRARVVVLTWTWPSRSYLLAVAAKLAFAWLIIRLVTSVLRNPFMVRLGSLSAWGGAGPR